MDTKGIKMRTTTKRTANNATDCYEWLTATRRTGRRRIETLGWKRLIPAALGWLVLSTVVIALVDFGVPWSQ